MLKTAFSLFLLRRLPFSDFDFPSWQSALALALSYGILLVFASNPQQNVLGGWDSPDSSVLLLLFVVIAPVIYALGIFVMVRVLRWWLKRGNRWDGQGNLFNLIAASLLAPTIIMTILVELNMHGLAFLVGLHSWLVSANAISGAIPKASVGYSLVGIFLSSFAIGLAFAVLGGVIYLIGVQI